MKRKDPKYKHDYVLLLDDSELDNFINQKIIEATFFAKKVYVNTSSKSALEFLSNVNDSIGASEIFPTVIFVDINMPMIDGFQFIEHLKKSFPKRYKSLSIIILTSSLSPLDKEKAMKLEGNVKFLNKPLTQEALNIL